MKKRLLALSLVALAVGLYAGVRLWLRRRLLTPTDPSVTPEALLLYREIDPIRVQAGGGQQP